MVDKMSCLRRIFAIAMTVALVFAFSITALAESDDSKVKYDFSNMEWDYKILDENGNVLESGTVPYLGPGESRFSWTGITLANNQTAVFMPSGTSGLYALAGTRIETGWTLNRSAMHRTIVSGNSYNYASGNGFMAVNTTYHVVKFFNAQHSDFFYGTITNLSSDSFTINNFYIYF